jgi:hypothetical protein
VSLSLYYLFATRGPWKMSPLTESEAAAASV